MNNSSACAPALSIVITAWNRADMVADAVESVLVQDCPALLEVVVLDDRSADGTLSTLADLERRPLPPSGLIRVIAGDHQGRSGAAQPGIDAACATYVALLSSDDRWKPHRACELLAEEQRLGGNALIHTDWKEIDRSGKLIRGGRGVRPPYRRAPFEYARTSDGKGILGAYVTSALRRRIHARRQRRLAGFDLWPGLAAEQMTTVDAIVRLLEQVASDERSMIAVMQARRRLLVLRESCREQHRLSCLAGSLGVAPVALVFPALWITVLCNIQLAVSPRLHGAIRYGRPRRRLARPSS